MRKVVPLSFMAALLFSATHAAVFNTAPADVTTRAFSIVWVSDEPVDGATIHVFAEAAGTTELTGGLTIVLLTPAEALANGVVRVDARGLAKDTCFYYQTETETTSGTVLEPATPPFPEVCTALQTNKANAGGGPIVNDLIKHDILRPDDGESAGGSLLLLDAPALGAYPLSAFVGDGFDAPAAVVDLNNLFDASTTKSADVPAGEALQLTEYRGLICPGLSDHRLLRLRRAPEHEEIATIGRAITELETAVPCFFADTDCNDVVNILDAQRVLNVWATQSTDCLFNPDLDISPDQEINILDFQGVLNRFGETAPFDP